MSIDCVWIPIVAESSQVPGEYGIPEAELGLTLMLAHSPDKPLTSLELANPHILLRTLQALRQTVYEEGQERFAQWRSQIQRPQFLQSALNLAYYLALRRQDLRPLQSALMPWGLSSLGRIESRVMPNLDAVIATLEAICHADLIHTIERPPIEAFFEGDRLLQQRTEELFGPTLPHRRVRIMVTLPTDAATDAAFVKDLIQRGADCVRINCAHDTPDHWRAMIQQVRQAERQTGRRCRILMDLGGPKPRTGPVLSSGGSKRVQVGDYILLVRNPDQWCAANEMGGQPAQALWEGAAIFQTSCSIPTILDQLQTGASVWIDDGKIGARVVGPEAGLVMEGWPDGCWLRVFQVPPKGARLRPDKGLNFPDSVLPLSPLTTKDLRDLDFVAVHADIVGYSFVQTAADIQLLQQELENRLPVGSPIPAIVAKIETPMAIRNLPDLIVQAAGKQPFGVMIARGDLAVEIGYQRLAEMQEEILWLSEAAHVPVIWATQVLEGLVKNGTPSRGEITDAAMSERAECVMLNKGPFVTVAVTILDDVLTRMQAHQLKKTPQLRALHSW